MQWGGALIVVAGLVGVFAGVQVALDVEPAAVGWAIVAGSVLLATIGVAVLCYIGWRISDDS